MQKSRKKKEKKKQKNRTLMAIMLIILYLGGLFVYAKGCIAEGKRESSGTF